MSLYTESIYQKDLTITCNGIVNVNKLKNSSVVVTGATGLIGSYIVETLIKLNELRNMNIKIYAVGRSIERLTARFGYMRTNNLHLIENDVNSDSELELNAADYIVHAASNANPKMFHDDPVGTILGNTIGTKKLLDWANKHNVTKFLYVSSGEVYGQLDRSYVPFAEHESGYMDQMQIRSCYPIAKRVAENLCVSFSEQYGLDTVIVRPSHIFGPTYTEKDDRVSAVFFRDVLNGQNITLKSEGKQFRSYCYVSDCVSSILSVLTSGRSENAYNCTNTSNAITLADFARTIAEHAGQKLIFNKKKQTNLDTPIDIAVLDDTKTRELGWKPQFSVGTGVDHVLKVLRNK